VVKTKIASESEKFEIDHCFKTNKNIINQNSKLARIENNK